MHDLRFRLCLLTMGLEFHCVLHIYRVQSLNSTFNVFSYRFSNVHNEVPLSVISEKFYRSTTDYQYFAFSKKLMFFGELNVCMKEREGIFENMFEIQAQLKIMNAFNRMVVVFRPNFSVNFNYIFQFLNIQNNNVRLQVRI